MSRARVALCFSARVAWPRKYEVHFLLGTGGRVVTMATDPGSAYNRAASLLGIVVPLPAAVRRVKPFERIFSKGDVRQ